MIETQFKALAPDSATIYLEPLKAACALNGIDTPARTAHFLAQCAHESANFTRFVENLNYSADGLAATWPNRFRDVNGKPSAKALALHRKPEAIANVVYANRMGNGDDTSGDGWRYRGRGMIQLTGKDNYRMASQDIYGDDRLVQDPDEVLKPDTSALVAAWFWTKNNLNELADRGDVRGITRRINGGFNGLAHREELTNKAILA